MFPLASNPPADTQLPPTRHLARAMAAGSMLFTLMALSPATAQTSTSTQPASPDHWADCAGLADNPMRLACFDRWAARQSAASASATVPAHSQVLPAMPLADATAAPAPATATPTDAAGGQGIKVATAGTATTPTTEFDPGDRPCLNPGTSPLSRFWELEPASDCGTFGIRVNRPLSLSWIGSDSVNTAPSSPSAGHTATTAVAYSTAETRIQLSVRTKIARGLLTDGDSPRRDSLWFGYTQQSYWQLFSPDISRPFRSTDHEPELTYIFPTDVPLEGGWRWRYAGLSLNHQSNGQSLPLSRSWNRIILMAGLENGDRFNLRARAWARVPEKSGLDDNPDISDLVGRAEVAATWNVNKIHTLGLTLRHSLRSSARGSVRLEWLRAAGPTRANGEPGGLRWHVQLFRGYGDSLLDYNRRRTVLSVGLSLVDF